MSSNQKPSIGRIVHFVNGGVHYAAIITSVYPDGWQPPCVDLSIFPPGNDAVYDSPVAPATCIAFSENPTHGTWHWPEREA